MGWTAPERRWACCVLHSVLPVHADERAWEPLDLGTLDHAGPPLRLGVRAAVWWMTWAPLLTPGFWRPLHHLSEERREAWVQHVGASPGLLQTQVILALKVVAGLGLDHLRTRPQ
jgi:hypothetical protein